MNLANKLTILRILLVPFFVIFMVWDFGFNLMLALIIFAVASITDFIDGYIARKYNMITEIGKFLDPLADKILVMGALILFVELGWAPAWCIIIIVSREFIVSGIRLVAAGSDEKKVISAGILGKIKTAFTMIAIVAVLFLFSMNQLGFFMNLPLVEISMVLIYISTLLTIVSGADYVIKYRYLFSKAE